MRIPFPLALAAIAALACVPVATAGAAPARTLDVPLAYTPVVAGFIGGETAPVAGTDGHWHVVYELWLTNTQALPATIERVEVLDFDDQARTVATLAGDALAHALHELSARPASDATLAPQASKLVFVELDFPSRAQVPRAIVHRLTGTGAAGPAAHEASTIREIVAPWDLTTRVPVVIGRPLEGDGWVVLNGCCTGGGAHRGAVLPISGKLYDSQRFAIDWMRIGKDGRFVLGDPSDVASYLGYDQRVLAVAAGRVTEAVDSFDDQRPGKLPDPATITVETIDGNHVVIEIAPGTYVFYAHLKRGSINVKPGDRVVPGQELGRLGNTGNTSAPHLHLHVMTGPSALAADGLPYVYAAFTLQGALDRAQWDLPGSDMGTTYRVLPPADPAAAQRHDELPLDLTVVDFGYASAGK